MGHRCALFTRALAGGTAAVLLLAAPPAMVASASAGEAVDEGGQVEDVAVDMPAVPPAAVVVEAPPPPEPTPTPLRDPGPEEPPPATPAPGKDDPAPAPDPEPAKDGPEQVEQRPEPAEDDPGSGKDDPGSGKDDPGSGKDDPGSGKDDPGSGKDDPGSGKDEPKPGKDEPDPPEDDGEEPAERKPGPEPQPGSDPATGSGSARSAPSPDALSRAVTSSPSAPRGSSGGVAIWSGRAGEALSTEWLGYLAMSGLEPSDYALEDIPPEMLELYQAATLICPGLPWTVLAGVGKVETDHGRNVAVSSAGARGPMQFLPSTWRQYGIDGDGDGRAQIDAAADAVYSASAYLCDHGAGDPETLSEALYAYNNALWYVRRVLRLADRYSVGSWDDVEEQAAVDRQELLDNPRLVVYPGGRADIAAGRIDPRVLDLLALLTQQHEITVVALRSGHSKYIAGTNRVSLHYYGQAVDIAVIDGEPVRSDSPRARALVTWLASLNGPQRPSEVGSPFADFQDQAGHFSNAAHMGHVHIGWGPRPGE